ncbi:MAG TPA: hypothetical protein VGQ81_11615, partial [Acidobacteriota bacterium]|nr:hypothetical protein [Acidobacteriota bacterium]
MKPTGKRQPRRRRRQSGTKKAVRGEAKTAVTVKKPATSTPKITVPKESDMDTGTRTPASLVDGQQFYKGLVDAVFDGVLIHQDGIVR